MLYRKVCDKGTSSVTKAFYSNLSYDNSLFIDPDIIDPHLLL